MCSWSEQKFKKFSSGILVWYYGIFVSYRYRWYLWCLNPIRSFRCFEKNICTLSTWNICWACIKFVYSFLNKHVKLTSKTKTLRRKTSFFHSYLLILSSNGKKIFLDGEFVLKKSAKRNIFWAAFTTTRLSAKFEASVRSQMWLRLKSHS